MQQRTRLAVEDVLGARLTGTRVLAVTSGKGGVGKTSLSLNLGLALARRGQRVLILDADLGMANINIMLGFEPAYTLWDVVAGGIPLSRILVKGPEGIGIIPGGSGIVELADLGPVEISRIIEGFRELQGECDWLMVDTGAGISERVLAFVVAADEALVVTTPEPTAMADAYGLIKAVWAQEGRVALKLVMNRVGRRETGEEMGGRLVQLAKKMLTCDVAMLGVVSEDPRVSQSVLRQQPFALAHPHTVASQDVGALADRLLDRVPPPRRGGVGGFFNRLAQNLPFRTMAGEETS